MSSLEELMRRPGYPYVATNPNVPSHLSPVMQVVSRDEILHEDGSWREGNPIYMTSQPTGSSRASQPSLPRETTKRKNLQEKHPSDWRNHHRLEIDGEKLELRNVDGRAVYNQAPLTEADKRQRLSSTYIGYTKKTKAEREAIGKETIKSFQSQPYDPMNPDAQCQGFARTLGSKLKTTRGAGLPPEPFRSQMSSTEWVAKTSKGNPMVKEALTKLGSGGHKLVNALKKSPSSS